MITYLRQLSFCIYIILLRWPIFLLIYIIGRTGIFKTVFLVYPTDEIEALGYLPEILFLRRYSSGRPIPAGFIMDGWLPMGIYFVINKTQKDLMLKKNRHTAVKIVDQMFFYRKLAGAKTIGLAGQLGPIFSRHNIPIIPPIYTSFYGNIYSISKAINWISRQKKSSNKQKVAIIGGGELGISLQNHLERKNYDCKVVNVRYTVRFEAVPVRSSDYKKLLRNIDYVINLMPRGSDFIASRLAQFIPDNAAIIDFSRPRIPKNQLTQKVYMGNCVRRSNMRFVLALPGGWKQNQLPACALPALIASFGNFSVKSNEEFALLANYMGFETELSKSKTGNKGDTSK